MHPRQVDHELANCAALAIAFPLEAAPWVISLRKLGRDRGGRGWFYWRGIARTHARKLMVDATGAGLVGTSGSETVVVLPPHRSSR